MPYDHTADPASITTSNTALKGPQDAAAAFAAILPILNVTRLRIGEGFEQLDSVIRLAVPSARVRFHVFGALRKATFGTDAPGPLASWLNSHSSAEIYNMVAKAAGIVS